MGFSYFYFLEEWASTLPSDFIAISNNTFNINNNVPIYAWYDEKSRTVFFYTDISALSSWDTSNVTDVSYMFGYCSKMQGTFTIKGNPTLYDEMFVGVATEGAGLVVNYSRNTTNIDAIIGTKSSNSNVTKGSQID